MDTWMEEQHTVLTPAGQKAAWLCMVGCGLPVTAGAVTAGEDRRRNAALSRRSAGIIRRQDVPPILRNHFLVSRGGKVTPGLSAALAFP